MHKTRIKKLLCIQSEISDPFINLAIEEILFRNPTFIKLKKKLAPIHESFSADSAHHHHLDVDNNGESSRDPVVQSINSKSIAFNPQKSRILFLFRNQKCLVIGRNQNPFKEINFNVLIRQNIVLVRRNSGGGTVYHDLENTNYSHIMPRAQFSKSWSTTLATKALHMLGLPSASVTVRNDITVQSKKVSGSAYKLTNQRAYHHGTMLIGTDLSILNPSLKKSLHNQHPSENNSNQDNTGSGSIVIKGGGIESVPALVTTLNKCLTLAGLEDSKTRPSQQIKPITHEKFCHALITQYHLDAMNNSTVNPNEANANQDSPNEKQETYIIDNDCLTPEIISAAKNLCNNQWIYGQTPSFELITRYQGNVMTTRVVKGILESCVVLEGSGEKLYEEFGGWLGEQRMDLFQLVKWWSSRTRNDPLSSNEFTSSNKLTSDKLEYEKDDSEHGYSMDYEDSIKRNEVEIPKIFKYLMESL